MLVPRAGFVLTRYTPLSPCLHNMHSLNFPHHLAVPSQYFGFLSHILLLLRLILSLLWVPCPFWHAL